MNCERAQSNIVLYAYGELADETTHELENHMLHCEACRREFQAVQALQNAMALAPVIEPSPNLIAQARLRLDEALDNMPAPGFFSRVSGEIFSWFSYVKTAPALTALLLGVGFVGGHVTHRIQVARAPKAPQTVILRNGSDGVISNVNGVVQTPNSEIVQVNYDRVVPETIQGSLDDPQIRSLLLLGSKNASEPNVRANSVSLLADECRAGHACDGGPMRNALMVSLRYDKSPAVRMKALAGLQPYISQDTQVRDAVLETLLNDPNANVRTAAVNLLQPVHADSSVRQVMHTVSTQDENPYIRTASMQVLQQSSGIQ